MAVDVIPGPGAQVRILRRLQVNQLRGWLIDERLCGAKEGQRTVGGIDKGRQADGGGEGGREKGRVEAITNEGVPELKDDIHDGREGAGEACCREKEKERRKGGRGDNILGGE